MGHWTASSRHCNVVFLEVIQRVVNLDRVEAFGVLALTNLVLLHIRRKPNLYPFVEILEVGQSFMAGDS